MKGIALLLIVFLALPSLTAQIIELGGKVTIAEMDTITTNANIVVRQADGTLSEKDLKLGIISYWASLTNGIQELLNRGEHPMNLYKAGVPLDSLYGKLYQGGLIFYLDTQDTIAGIEGLVSALSDLESEDPLDYGCWGLDIPNVPSVTSVPPSGDGAEIGDGSMNTDSILTWTNCNQLPEASMACDDLIHNGYDDWFLPSILELGEMYTKLRLSGFGGFTNNYYWSSTEYDSNDAWVLNFTNNDVQHTVKEAFLFQHVRAIRAF